MNELNGVKQMLGRVLANLLDTNINDITVRSLLTTASPLDRVLASDIPAIEKLVSKLSSENAALKLENAKLKETQEKKK